MRTILTVLLFLGFGTHVAAASAGTYTVFGDGNESCSTWDVDRQRNFDKTDEQYVLGFISGLGDFQGSNSNVTLIVHADANEVFAWIDNFCQSHPAYSLAYAADRFWVKSGTIQP
jgi:hypothetical protein